MHAEFFLAVIGRRFGSAGLHDLIVEASLSGLESVNQILNDKEYNYEIMESAKSYLKPCSV